MSRNAHIWRGHGVTAKGMATADAAMPDMLRAVAAAGGLARIVFTEAFHQVNALPLRGAEYRRKWEWKPKRGAK